MVCDLVVRFVMISYFGNYAIGGSAGDTSVAGAGAAYTGKIEYISN